MKKKIIAIGILMLVIVTVLSGCVSNHVSNVKKPYFAVTSKVMRTGYKGIDYVVWVDATIYNGGGAGSQRVFCQVNQDGNEYMRSKRIYLDSYESTSITFEFSEYSWWSSDGGSYLVWVANIG